jgi:hypothetical protein
VVGVVSDWNATVAVSTYTGSAVKVWDDTRWGPNYYCAYHFYYTTMNTSGSVYTGGLLTPTSPANQGICLLEIKSA